MTLDYLTTFLQRPYCLCNVGAGLAPALRQMSPLTTTTASLSPLISAPRPPLTIAQTPKPLSPLTNALEEML